MKPPLSHSGQVGTSRILVTGATGFIGHYVLAELLQRQLSCAVLLRPKLHKSTQRLEVLLRDLGVDLEQHVAHGRLVLLEGDLTQQLPSATGVNIGSILHVAASTQFESDGHGNPWQTNVVGTQHLLNWAKQRGIQTFHLVSSAYRCGQSNGPVAEAIDTSPPDFHNDYEHSKWQAEHHAIEWADENNATLTVYRPSIVVGDQDTGRATNFGGFYVMARANEMLAQSYDIDDPARRDIPLRVVGLPEGQQNMVPVDYVANMIAHAVCDPQWHGQVYHLTHPDAPTNEQIKQAFEEHFDISGGGFIKPDQFDETALTEMERMFYQSSRPIRHYLTDTPNFQRSRADELESAAGVCCPSYQTSQLRDLIRYAQATRWGKRRPRIAIVAHQDDELIDIYFQQFLPQRVANSYIAQMTALTTTMRFVLSDVPKGYWVCRFVAGLLIDVQRTALPSNEDFTYTTTREIFWQSVKGQTDPQRVFLDDQASVSGDIESALKMAMILQQFNREFPCDPALLTTESPRLCTTA